MAEIIEMPKLSDTMTTGTLVSWLKNEGDTVATGDMVAEVETDKATMEVECFADGVLIKQYIQKGASLPVGAPLCAIGEPGEAAPSVDAAPAPQQEAPAPEAPSETTTAAPAPTPAVQTPASNKDIRVKASPLARKIAAEKNIALENVQGSGPGGRILKVDVLTAKAAPAQAISPVTSDLMGEDITIPVSNMRSVIARRLVESKTQIPHFYLNTDVDAVPFSTLRAKVNKKLANLDSEKGGVKITVNDLILKATTEALRRVPEINASWMGDHIKQHGSIHLAFGVAIDDGLVTPVIRDAQTKTLRQISIEAKNLIGKARSKKLSPDEMTGSTFTVTNLGMFGVKNFYGIINPPNAGILSISAAVKTPVVDEEGNITIGELMSLGFSGDHRVVDGAAGANFLGALKDVLETPESMLV